MRTMAILAAFLSVFGLAFLVTHEESWIQQRTLQFVFEYSTALPYLLLTLITVLVFLLISLRLYFFSQKKALEEIASENLFLSQAFGLISKGVFVWRYADGEPTAREYCSRRLATLLGLGKGTDSGFSDVIRYFDSVSAETIVVNLATLRNSGKNFSLEATAAQKERRFLIRGERVFADGERTLADLLWVRDITEEELWRDKLEEEHRSLLLENSRLRRFQDSLPFPVWIRDFDLNLVYCNHTYAMIVGAPSPSAVISGGIELLAGTQVREARTLAIRARAIGQARSGQFHLVINQERRLMEVTEAPLKDAGEGARISVGFAIDRTHQEELENTLKNHILAHANVLENLTTAIAIFDKDTRLIFFNATFSKLWDVNPDWLSSQPTYGNFLDMLRELRRLPEVVDYRAFKSEELKLFTSLINPLETLLHLPSGKALRRLVSPHPFGGLLATYEDVTDTLALTSSYNALIAVQREIINNLYEGVAMFGADGRLILFNKAYAQLSKFDEHLLASGPHINELEEWSSSMISEPSLPQRDAWRRCHAAAFSVSGERKGSSGRIEWVDGRSFKYTCVPLPDGAVLVLWLDVSASVQMERTLWERNEALSRDNHLKVSFLSAIAREIRAPLETIVSQAETLANGFTDGEIYCLRTYGRNIADAAKTLMMLVDNILDLAAGGDGHRVFQSTAAELSEILALSVTLVRETAQTREVSFTVECPDDSCRMIIVEPRFKLAIFAVVSELLMLTASGGHITLSCRWYDDEKNRLMLDFFNTDAPVITMKRYIWDESPSLRQVLFLIRNLIKPHGGNIIVFHNAEGDKDGGKALRMTCQFPSSSPEFSMFDPLVMHVGTGRELLQ